LTPTLTPMATLYPHRAASIAAVASHCISGMKLEYVSRVTPIGLGSSISETAARLFDSPERLTDGFGVRHVSAAFMQAR
jgi:hypothetical protein